MLFATLPKTFPSLEKVARDMGGVSVTPPPPMEEIGKRLRVTFERARHEQYRGLSRVELRKLPFAYWVKGEPPLPDVHPQLLKQYWTEVLPEAFAGGGRRARRWLLPLLYTYCEAFDSGDAKFLDFASKLCIVIDAAGGALAERLQHLQRSRSFFDPKQAPNHLAQEFLLGAKGLSETMQELLLWDGFFGSALGGEVFASALQVNPERLREWAVVSRLLELEQHRMPARVVKTAQRVRFAEALLRPWRRGMPPDLHRSKLMRLFVSQYGDPRVTSHASYQWHGVAEDAVSVLMRWLAGDSLRCFMRILARTADDIWRYRQKFWMAYYDAGYVEDAWLVLGPDAKKVIGDVSSDLAMRYGVLDGGTASNQSVLLLRIGDLIFTEWSHNGSLRAYREGSTGALTFYRARYHAHDLRMHTSLDFHFGQNKNPELRHVHSESGSWQRKARDFIRSFTRLYLGDRDIL